MKYQGVIFDFNGVLLWDRALHERAWAEFAQRLRPQPFTREEMAAQMHGRSNHDILEYLSGRSLSRAEAEELARRKETIYRELCLDLGDDFRLSPGAVEVLEWLAARAVPYTIATASGPGNVAFFVEHLHLENWFRREKIVYNDGTFPMKPAPDIYLRAAAVLGVETAVCLVIEDAISGIRAAHAAGAGGVIALGPRDRHERLAAVPGVSGVIERLDQLLTDGWLNGTRMG
jgi:beta-phosphoglucomutase-like phosphatase (HAD superfamily)